MSLGLTINQLVESNLPADFSVSMDYIETRLKYWQTLLYEAANVGESDKYDICKWSDKWQILLSYCITYDIYVRVLSGSFIAIAGSTGGSSEGGTIKSITTGPTEVEYHNDSEALAMLLKTLKDPEGPFYSMLALACGFANNLGVKLPFCRAKKHVSPLLIGKTPLKGKAYYNYITKKVYGKANKPSSMG